ncbi:MAG: SufD family Fe-S cluster assembly protein [Marmoricola sp.]
MGPKLIRCRTWRSKPARSKAPAIFSHRRFDDQQLFYLRSRGIDEQEARRLVVHGFFHDLLRRIGVADLEEELAQIVEAELARTVTAEVNA